MSILNKYNYTYIRMYVCMYVRMYMYLLIISQGLDQLWNKEQNIILEVSRSHYNICNSKNLLHHAMLWSHIYRLTSYVCMYVQYVRNISYWFESLQCLGSKFSSGRMRSIFLVEVAQGNSWWYILPVQHVVKLRMCVYIHIVCTYLYVAKYVLYNIHM